MILPTSSVLLQKEIERLEPLEDALRVVEAIDRYDYFALAYPPPYPLDFPVDIRIVGCPGKPPVVYPHGECLCPHYTVADRDLTESVLISQQAADALQKMPHVVKGVESDQICLQQSPQYIFSPGKQTEYLKRWKRYMEKKAYRSVRHPLPDQTGKEHQLIVMYPDNVARLCDLHYGIAEELIDSPVRLPQISFIDGILGEAVEERPDGSVAEPAIVHIDVSSGEMHGVAIEIGH